MKPELSATKKGFSLVEALIAVAIFAIIVSSVITELIYANRYLVSSGLQLRAVLLAEEGLEAARNLRNSDFSSLAEGVHGLATSGNNWSFSGTEDTKDVFKRKITISSVNAETKKVVSEISWSDKGTNRTASLGERLTDWRKGKLTAISRWPFDENSGCDAHDSAGSNDGTLQPNCSSDSPVWVSAGNKKVGVAALRFDGSNDYVRILDDNSLDLSAAGTIMAWIYPTRQGLSGVVHKGTASNGSDEAYFLRLDSNRRLVGGGRNSANATVSVQTISASALSLNNWYHIAFTWDTTGLKIYINGVLKTPDNASILNARNSSGALLIGALYPSNNRFQGTIDEVSLYGSALTVDQVLNIYNAEK